MVQKRVPDSTDDEDTQNLEFTTPATVGPSNYQVTIDKEIREGLDIENKRALIEITISKKRDDGETQASDPTMELDFTTTAAIGPSNYQVTIDKEIREGLDIENKRSFIELTIRRKRVIEQTE